MCICTENEWESPYPAQFGKSAGKQHSDSLKYVLFVHPIARHDIFVSEQIGAFGHEYFVDVFLYGHGKLLTLQSGPAARHCGIQLVPSIQIREEIRLKVQSAFDVEGAECVFSANIESFAS